MPDLGSGAARRVGSSPIIRTEKASEKSEAFLFLEYFLNKILHNKPFILILFEKILFLNLYQLFYIFDLHQKHNLAFIQFIKESNQFYGSSSH
jgi:hypothetical protein